MADFWHKYESGTCSSMWIYHECLSDLRDMLFWGQLRNADFKNLPFITTRYITCLEKQLNSLILEQMILQMQLDRLIEQLKDLDVKDELYENFDTNTSVAATASSTHFQWKLWEPKIHKQWSPAFRRMVRTVLTVCYRKKKTGVGLPKHIWIIALSFCGFNHAESAPLENLDKKTEPLWYIPQNFEIFISPIPDEHIFEDNNVPKPVSSNILFDEKINNQNNNEFNIFEDIRRWVGITTILSAILFII